MMLSLSEEEVPTPLGGLILVTDGEGTLRAAEWADGRERLSRLLARQYATESYTLSARRVAAPVRKALASYFAGDTAALRDVKLSTGGTPFQRRVWDALRDIPAGETLSYGALGLRIGLAGHARAIGHANAANPINIVVPCHRLVGSAGHLTGYAGGIERKRWLLAHEGAAIRR